MTQGRDALLALAVIMGVPLLLAGWVVLAERIIRPLGRRSRNRARPWLWLVPGLIFIVAILIYPFFATIRFAFGDGNGQGFVGFDNFVWAVTRPENLEAIRNTVAWMIVLPIAVLIIGLVFALLADRVRYERAAKSIVMIPSVFSLVVGSVVWGLMYRYSPPGANQSGLVNAVYTGVTGNPPIGWLLEPAVNNAALMVIGLWMWLGFAMLLISAGIKGVPVEYLEAARIDGANEFQIFFNITLRQLIPTLLVVLTTLTVWALKVFDIVYVMTLGRYGTQVLGTRVYEQLFNEDQFGQGSALVILMILITVPVMLINIWRNRQEEKA